MARTIGRKYKNQIERLVAEYDKTNSPQAVFNFVKDRLSVEAFETWEGAYDEIRRLSEDFLSKLD